ncbi:hypothetical protein AAY473_033984 [Plecturocebus cupreus]
MPVILAIWKAGVGGCLSPGVRDQRGKHTETQITLLQYALCLRKLIFIASTANPFPPLASIGFDQWAAWQEIRGQKQSKTRRFPGGGAPQVASAAVLASTAVLAHAAVLAGAPAWQFSTENTWIWAPF